LCCFDCKCLPYWLKLTMGMTLAAAFDWHTDTEKEHIEREKEQKHMRERKKDIVKLMRNTIEIHVASGSIN
jgi:cytochrome b